MVSGVIIYAGRDDAVIRSRRLALQEAAYVVDVSRSSEEFLQRFFDGDYDLVVLCNSLRQAERERMAGLVHRFAPRTPVISVCGFPGENPDGADYGCTGEVQALLDLVVRLGQPPARAISRRQSA